MAGKIIYVSWMPLSAKVSRDWYIDHLISRGLEVEYWDVTNLLRGKLNQAGTKTADYLRTLHSFGEIEEQLQLPENKMAAFVMLVSYDGRRASFYRLFSSHACRMVFIKWGDMPVAYECNLLKKVWSRSRNPLLLAQDIFFRIKGIAFRKLKFVRPYEIVFAAGQTSMEGNYALRVVPINLCDFDNYKKASLGAGGLVSGAYAVYLDIYLPFQSDLKVCGMDAVTPHRYYASLNKFFQLVEEKYKIKVVIAAHPKAEYSADIFNGREIYYRQTPELVKDAEFVIAEHSTSVSYAVLNYKPIISIYTSEMESIYAHNFLPAIKSLSSYLGTTLCNIDEIKDSSQLGTLGANMIAYNKYKYSYLTSKNSENRNSEEIFCSELSNLVGVSRKNHP